MNTEGIMRENDKRRFTRYTNESLCEVIIDSEIYKGKVVDYSDGVGVLIKKIPQLIQGALADIRITDCEIEFGAEVAWTEDFGYHLRVGFKIRPVEATDNTYFKDRLRLYPDRL